MTPCHTFRRSLQSWLEGQGDRAQLAPMAWSEHVVTCERCRTLLEGEQALEVLLDTLPAPALSPDLTRRVLRRLAADRVTFSAATEKARPALASSLDQLLEQAHAPRVPASLAGSVLAGLDAQRHAAGGAEASPDGDLDRLLDRVGDERAPVGLAARTLAALESERGEGVRPRTIWLRRWNWTAALLAGLLFAFWWLERTQGVAPEPSAGNDLASRSGAEASGLGAGADFVDRRSDAVAAAEPRLPTSPEELEELLQNLDLLENWELIVGDDLDLLLSSVDPFDEALLELPADEGAEPEASASDEVVPSKG